MEYTIEVKNIDEDRISVLGKEYYAKEYLEEMMRREYQRGKREGQQQPQLDIPVIKEVIKKIKYENKQK